MGPKMRDWIRYIEENLSLERLEAPRGIRIVEELALEMEQTFHEALSEGASEKEADERARGVVGDWEELARRIERSQRSHRVPGPERWLTRSEDTVRQRRPAGSVLADFLHDLRFSLRILRKSPGFLSAAVLTLGLGVGANTAIFSLVHGVLLRPLGFRETGQLMTLWQVREDGSLLTTSPGNYADMRDLTASFSSMAGWEAGDLTVTGFGDPRILTGVFSIDSIFDVLEVPALFGRTFTSAETGPASESMVVLSYKTWRSLYGENRDIVGESITLNGNACPVIGVMPPDFSFPDEDAALWIAGRYSDEFLTVRTQIMLSVIARLGDGVSIEQARAELDAFEAHLREADPMTNERVDLRLIPLQEHVLGGVETRLFVLMGAVLFVLFIVCGNLANLLLARATRRRHEIATRLALGASRGRLVRQMLAEGGVLGLLGMVAGIGFGIVFQHTLLNMLPGDIPRIEEIGINCTVLAFCLGISLLAGFGFGLVPALSLPQRAAGWMLRETLGGWRVHLTRRVLVVTEVALATVLLVGAGLMLHSLALLQRIDPGFDRRAVLTFEVNLPAGRYRAYEQRVAFFDDALARLRRLPGVESVAASEIIPTSGDRHGAWLNIEGRGEPDTESPPVISYRSIAPGYFRTMRIPILRGRGLEDDDRSFDRPVVVINESLARQFWPGEDPIGKQVTIGVPTNPLIPLSEIIGIARDVKVHGLKEQVTPPVLYAPYYNLSYRTYMTFIARTSGDPVALLPAVRATISEMDPALPIFDIRTLEDVTGASIQTERSASLLLGLFAAVAMIVAAVGVFGVVACTISQRSRDIGIRMALGATIGLVQRQVVLESMRMVVLGAIIGLAGALILTRVLAGMVYGIPVTDPLTFAAAIFLLLVVAWLASFLPARHIARLDPITVLRSE